MFQNTAACPTRSVSAQFSSIHSQQTVSPSQPHKPSRSLSSKSDCSPSSSSPATSSSDYEYPRLSWLVALASAYSYHIGWIVLNNFRKLTTIEPNIMPNIYFQLEQFTAPRQQCFHQLLSWQPVMSAEQHQDETGSGNEAFGDLGGQF